MNKIVLATRKSPLALVQTEMVAACLREMLGVDTELLKVVTTGDKQADWSLEQRGGKGLFTAELEEAILRGDAQLAVHSTKDLPGEMVAGLTVAGYLPRANPRDVLVVRKGIENPKVIATGSPRRRLQLQMHFPDAEFTEIRGNVETRLRKISEGAADATVLALAGLSRLGIQTWDGLDFHPFDFSQMVPAVGQGAIGIQCRTEEAEYFAAALDARTKRHVTLERAFQSALGGGCHTAFGACVTEDTLFFFHGEIGLRSLPLDEGDFSKPEQTAQRILKHFGFSL